MIISRVRYSLVYVSKLVSSSNRVTFQHTRMASKVAHPDQIDTTVIEQDVLDIAELPPGEMKQVDLKSAN